MTAINEAHIRGEEDFETANKQNLSLARFMFRTYHDSDVGSGGIHNGGERRLLFAKQGDPGFKMVNHDSPLAALVGNLFQLLRNYYAAINFDDLERYKVVTPPVKVLPSKIVPYIARVMPPLPAEPAAPASVQPQPPPPNLGPRALDTHAEILRGFGNTLNTFERLAEEQNGRLYGDKLPDQFLGLPQFEWQPIPIRWDMLRARQS